ncbi:MAG: type II toxin-antitoxin system HicB family antitoxin [Rhodospirillaceae bacterium]
MSTKLYPGVIFQEEEGFSITFPDVAGAHSEGDTLDECLSMGQEALNLVLEVLAADKKPLPDASTVEAARAAAREVYPEGKILTVQFFEGALPGRAAKLAITMDENLVKRVDAAAGSYGRSGFIAEACREKLRAMHEMPLFELIDNKLTRALDILEGSTAPMSRVESFAAGDRDKRNTEFLSVGPLYAGPSQNVGQVRTVSSKALTGNFLYGQFPTVPHHGAPETALRAGGQAQVVKVGNREVVIFGNVTKAVIDQIQQLQDTDDEGEPDLSARANLRAELAAAMAGHNPGDDATAVRTNRRSRSSATRQKQKTGSESA